MLVLVKQFLRIDGQYNHEDDLLKHLISTAEEYIFNATGREFSDKSNIHRQILLLLVSNWYENRNIAITQDLDRTLTSMLLQAGIGDADG